MRLALVIVLLGAVAVALVHIRRAEMSARHEVQQLQADQVKVRRRLWDQQVHLSGLMSPALLRRQAAELDLIEADWEPYRLTGKE